MSIERALHADPFHAGCAPLTPFFWSQLFATAAFACGLASFQFRKRRTFLLLLISLALLNSCHFFLLDRAAPGCMLILTAMRYWTAMFTQRREALLLYLVVAIVACILTYNGPLSLLALVAVVLGTCGSFQRSDRIMRLCFLGGNSTWLTHNILAGTPVATLMEAAFLMSNIIGYRRFYANRPQHDLCLTGTDVSTGNGQSA